MAYNAVKGKGGQSAAPGQSAPLPPGGTVTAGKPGGGGLDDILGGLFGGKPGAHRGKPGGAPGGSPAAEVDMLPGGPGGLLGVPRRRRAQRRHRQHLKPQSSGQGRVAQPWVGTGPNQEIALDELANALGGDMPDAQPADRQLRDEPLKGAAQKPAGARR